MQERGAGRTGYDQQVDENLGVDGLDETRHRVHGPPAAAHLLRQQAEHRGRDDDGDRGHEESDD